MPTGKMMDIDITDKCEYYDNDGELLSLTKCACGRKFEPWDFIIGIYRDSPVVCECGRKLYFANNNTIYEVKEEGKNHE